MIKIFLVGFMASGKSTVAKKLAKELNLKFIDQDDYIEEKTGKTVPEIFAQDGEDRFREIEREVLLEFGEMDSANQDVEGFVIATGGGSPCFFDNMDIINKYGQSFYLKNTIDYFVHKLLTAKTVRPLVKDKTEDELREYIADTLAHREQFYNKAQTTISAEGKQPKKVVSAILNILNKK